MATWKMKISVLDNLGGANARASSSYLVIPFLDSTYKKYGQSVFKMINNANHRLLDAKYKDACIAIDGKFKDAMINIATLTVSHNSAITGGSSSSSKTKKVSSDGKKKSSRISISTSTSTRKNKNLNTLGAGLIQIYMVRINDAIGAIGGADSKLEEIRVAGHLIFSVLKGNFIRRVNIMPLLDSSHGGEKESAKNKGLILALLEGIMLSSYKFDKYKTAKALERQDTKEVYHLEDVYLITAPRARASKKDITRDISRLETIVASVFLARDLVNEPANDRRFDRFMARIKEFIGAFAVPVELEVWDKEKLEEVGMGLHLGVGKGSTPENAPRMLIVKYHPRPPASTSARLADGEGKGKRQEPAWVLLGKGITFDTGGLDLKSSKAMLDMKSDLSGAAAVVAFLLGYAACRGRRCIYAMCPFAENSISSKAVKPSDVLTAYDGRTVEIVDTDAEGRLLLADALAYTVATWPGARVMDLATLTGQAEDVSGKAFSVVLSSNAEKETAELIEKSEVINEALVRLPLLEKESSKLESNVADIKNLAFKSTADIIMSALFMKQFIRPETGWIHVDIAGPAYRVDEVIKYASPEASGVGVRLLFEYFSS